jgi:hypothetical protein
MRGRTYSTDGTLPERDLYELSDVFAMQLYRKLGTRAYGLTRNDVAEVLRPYMEDLVQEDRRVLPWLVWNLLQEGMEMEFSLR